VTELYQSPSTFTYSSREMPVPTITLEPILERSRFEGAPVARLVSRVLLLDSPETSIEPRRLWL